jgi:hypothetical protein
LLGELSERIFLSGGSVLTREDLSLNSHREKVDPHPQEKVRDGLPRALQERLEFPDAWETAGVECGQTRGALLG